MCSLVDCPLHKKWNATTQPEKQISKVWQKNDHVWSLKGWRLCVSLHWGKQPCADTPCIAPAGRKAASCVQFLAALHAKCGNTAVNVERLLKLLHRQQLDCGGKGKKHPADSAGAFKQMPHSQECGDVIVFAVMLVAVGVAFKLSTLCKWFVGSADVRGRSRAAAPKHLVNKETCWIFQKKIEIKKIPSSQQCSRRPWRGGAVMQKRSQTLQESDTGQEIFPLWQWKHHQETAGRLVCDRSNQSPERRKRRS